MTHHTVTWEDSGREPQCPPNPIYPNGIAVDISGGCMVTCVVKLPYPAKRCGAYRIHCDKCGINVALTTAGRPDDPVSIRLPCFANELHGK